MASHRGYQAQVQLWEEYNINYMAGAGDQYKFNPNTNTYEFVSSAGSTPAQTPTTPTSTYTQPTPAPTSTPQWNLSSWSVSPSGSWAQQPSLTVNGKAYTYSTPQEYAAHLQSLQSQGATGPVSDYISQLQGAKFGTQQQTTQQAQPTQQPSQQDLWLKPGETPEQYKARVAQLQGYAQPTTNVQPTGQQTTQQTTQQAGGQLAYDPAVNPSVVDLLNSVGQDASFAARQQLAQQYGMQGYTGTATQNQELAKKFTEKYNASKGAAPTSQAEYAQMSKDLVSDTPEKKSAQQIQDSFMSDYLSMNPVMKFVYDTMKEVQSYSNTSKSLREEISALPEFAERQETFTELMDIKRVMEGSEDDIREEITKAGGLATNSQVQALTGARNKVLIKQANALTDKYNVLNDYIDNITTLTKEDRQDVEDALDRKIGLSQMMFDMSQKIDGVARENYQSIVSNVGYAGLAEAVEDNPYAQRQAEYMLSLPNGALSNEGFFTLGGDADSKPYQFVSGTENQASGVFDPNTGTFKSMGGGTGTGSGSSRTLNLGNLVYGTPEYTTAAIQESAKYGKTRLLADERKDINAAKQALGSLEILSQLMNGKLDNAQSKEIFGEKTGVIAGRVRTLQGLWGADPNAAAVNAVIQGIIPTVARGIFREVGVLTDADIANYKKTVPDINKPENANRLIELVLLKTLERAYSNTLLTAAQNQTNVANFAGEYQDVLGRISKLSTPVSSAKTGTLPNGTKVTMNADGTIVDAKGNKYDENGNKIGAPIPWGAVKKAKIL